MSSKNLAIVWFRQDLRLGDNPALAAAAKSGADILPLYILDDDNPGDWTMGGASRWWLHSSLSALNDSLEQSLLCVRGNAAQLLPQIVKQFDASHVYWNRCYEPWRIRRDTQLMRSLRESGCAVDSSNASLLFEPQSVMKKDGTPYRVFTPYYRKGCLESAPTPRLPIEQPQTIPLFKTPDCGNIDALDLIPRVPWYKEMERLWTAGEIAANRQLDTFVSNGISDYDEGRNRPDRQSVSRLSPYLHFGEISPHRIWHKLHQSSESNAHVDRFLSEIGWREFSYYLLFHAPDIPHKNLQPKFDRFPWREDATDLVAWQKGMTGFPIVDAGMRELWQTGYMHNRVRMVVASFLVKNLLLHWRHGADWFWDTLLDADLANNSASWQWVAGSGADAAPYFRIFNPVRQGEKFDPEGIYVKRYVPELAALPKRYIHQPFSAPSDVLDEAGVTLGASYPQPIVDLKSSRERALAAFQQTRVSVPGNS